MLELAGKSAALKRWLAENEAKKVDGACARRPHLRTSRACRCLKHCPWGDVIRVILYCSVYAGHFHAATRGPCMLAPRVPLPRRMTLNTLWNKRCHSAIPSRRPDQAHKRDTVTVASAAWLLSGALPGVMLHHTLIITLIVQARWTRMRRWCRRTCCRGRR